jgi:hypothetical protein
LVLETEEKVEEVVCGDRKREEEEVVGGDRKREEVVVVVDRERKS